jgi:hypothetical protein
LLLLAEHLVEVTYLEVAVLEVCFQEAQQSQRKLMALLLALAGLVLLVHKQA